MSSFGDHGYLPVCLTLTASGHPSVYPGTVSVHHSVCLNKCPRVPASLRATGEVQRGEKESRGPGGIAGVCPPVYGHLTVPGSAHSSRPTELVVAESVVVIKKLLQMQPAQHGEIIKHLAKLTDNIQVSA